MKCPPQKKKDSVSSSSASSLLAFWDEVSLLNKAPPSVTFYLGRSDLSADKVSQKFALWSRSSYCSSSFA